MTEITRNYFDEKAAGWINESYDKGQTIAHVRLDAMLNLVRAYAPESVLDVGCGDGRFLRLLDTVKVRAGIDYSNRMIELATNSGSSIQFTQVDLNAEGDLKKLEKVGTFDLITMMGVIHYLSSPQAAIRGLRACAHNRTHLVVSFRNRLLNTLGTSQYYKSPLNQGSLKRLEDEIEVWARVGLASDNLSETLGNDAVGRQLTDTVYRSKSFEGVTDNYWNPERFEHWRQFTPLDAVTLMQQSGFQAERIVPLISRSPLSDEAAAKDSIADRDAISNSSSFLIVARYQDGAKV